MPRGVRKHSETGIYHVMLRGVNKQQIFLDNEDCLQFLECLYLCKQISQFKLYAYCLMGNHVHLLINAKKEPIASVMKRLGSKYVYWYNSKYARVGHLFQDRFRSEPVEDDAYFLTVLRYIHMNPVKAGIVSVPEDYAWSSYREYFDGGRLIDSKLVMTMLDASEFVLWHRQSNDDVCLDVDDVSRQPVSDRVIVRLIAEITGSTEIEDFVRLPDHRHISCVLKLYLAGASIRQISRLTGWNKNRVERLLKQ